MSRFMVADLGNQKYIVESSDAIRLLEIANRAILVEGYPPTISSKPFEAFCSRVEYVEVGEPKAEAIEPAPSSDDHIPSWYKLLTSD